MEQQTYYPIAQHPDYLSGAPRFPNHRIAIGQLGRHLLNGMTLSTFLTNYDVPEENIYDLFDLLPETLPCGVSRQDIRRCVMTDEPLDSLYLSTDLSEKEMSDVLKKSWRWSPMYAFWWGDFDVICEEDDWEYRFL